MKFFSGMWLWIILTLLKYEKTHWCALMFNQVWFEMLFCTKMAQSNTSQKSLAYKK